MRRIATFLAALFLAFNAYAVNYQSLIGVSGAFPTGSSAVCTFAGNASNTTSQTSVTVASVPIGTASSDRWVVVGINSINNTGTNPISSVTIGGVAATIVVQLSPGTSADFSSGASAIAIANVTTGTTATVAWHVTSASVANSVVAWTITGLNSSTATSTASAGSGNPMALTLSSVSAGGCAFATVQQNHASQTYTWGQLVSDGNFVTSNTVPFSGAHKSYASLQTNLAVTVQSSDGAAGASSAAAFR